jgi:FKBP-type peptidyl-prolyl cis-trans isomerase (trigger factor)
MKTLYQGENWKICLEKYEQWFCDEMYILHYTPNGYTRYAIEYDSTAEDMKLTLAFTTLPVIVEGGYNPLPISHKRFNIPKEIIDQAITLWRMRRLF